MEEERDPRQDPLGRLLLGLEVECPDVGGSALPRLVDRAVVEVPQLLLVLGDGLDEHDRHGWVQLLQPGLHDGPGGNVPPVKTAINQ